MHQNKCCHLSQLASRCSFIGNLLLLVLFGCIPDFADGMYYGHYQQQQQQHPNQWSPTATTEPPQPHFVTSVSRNATVRQGDPAFLSCKVENLGTYTVSWIRLSDLHILTVDRYTYTADQRFQSLYSNETDEWSLHIKWTERKDTGIYECQVSTLPVKSLALYLIVLDESELVRRQDDILYDLPVPAGLPEPKRSSMTNNGDIYNRMYADRDYMYLSATTQILEGTMVYGYKGEDLNLTCIVNHNYDRRPNHVIWYHQNDIVAYESLRKRDKSPLNSITSYHLIRNVDFDDAGNYTCAPELYGSASAIVHILDGDEMQSAMGGSNRASAWRSQSGSTSALLGALVAASFCLCIFYYHPDNAR